MYRLEQMWEGRQSMERCTACGQSPEPSHPKAKYTTECLLRGAILIRSCNYTCKCNNVHCTKTFQTLSSYRGGSDRKRMSLKNTRLSIAVMELVLRPSVLSVLWQSVACI